MSSGGYSFAVIDVETSNKVRGSICQVGIATFEDGELTGSRDWLVHPRTTFNAEISRIHGITLDRVRNAPPWADVYPEVRDALGDRLVVSYTLFDYQAMLAACERVGVIPHPHRWLDATSVVRSVWTDVARRGFGLRPMAERLGIALRHHDAAEDARAAGLVLIEAVRASGLPLDHWAGRHSIVLEPGSAWRVEKFQPPIEGETQAETVEIAPTRLPSITEGRGCILAWVVFVAFCVIVLVRSCHG